MVRINGLVDISFVFLVAKSTPISLFVAFKLVSLILAHLFFLNVWDS